MMTSKLIQGGEVTRQAAGKKVRYSYASARPVTPDQEDQDQEGRSPLYKATTNSCKKSEVKDGAEELAGSVVKTVVEQVVKELKPKFADISDRAGVRDAFNEMIEEKMEQKFNNLPMMEDLTQMWVQITLPYSQYSDLSRLTFSLRSRQSTRLTVFKGLADTIKEGIAVKEDRSPFTKQDFMEIDDLYQATPESEKNARLETLLAENESLRVEVGNLNDRIAQLQDVERVLRKTFREHHLKAQEAADDMMREKQDIMLARDTVYAQVQTETHFRERFENQVRKAIRSFGDVQSMKITHKQKMLLLAVFHPDKYEGVTRAYEYHGVILLEAMKDMTVILNQL